MKKIFKSRIFIVIITLVIGVSGTLYATTKYKAIDVAYISSDGKTVTVNDALNELYQNKYSSFSKILVATDVTADSSNHIATVDCKKISNYQELTIDDFYLDMKSFKMQWKGTSGPHTFSKQWYLTYDNNSGILTIKEFYIIVSLGTDLYGKVWPIVDLYIIK